MFVFEISLIFLKIKEGVLLPSAFHLTCIYVQSAQSVILLQEGAVRVFSFQEGSLNPRYYHCFWGWFLIETPPIRKRKKPWCAFRAQKTLVGSTPQTPVMFKNNLTKRQNRIKKKKSYHPTIRVNRVNCEKHVFCC